MILCPRCGSSQVYAIENDHDCHTCGHVWQREISRIPDELTLEEERVRKALHGTMTTNQVASTARMSRESAEQALWRLFSRGAAHLVARSGYSGWMQREPSS